MKMNHYQQLLSLGKKTICLTQPCGDFKQQLQNLHDFVFVVEATPHPEDSTYSEMFLDCIIHSSLWTPELQQQLKRHNFSFSVFDYCHDSHCFFQPKDTMKHRLLYEMVGKWWFFRDTMAPAMALSEAIHFRDWFFDQPFADLPEKFRKWVKQGGIQYAMDQLSPKEHLFLDKIISDMTKTQTSVCGCFPVKRTSFSQRLVEPTWHELPELEIYEIDGIDVNVIHDAVVGGELLYMMISNYHDGVDRNLYQDLYTLFKTSVSNNGKYD